ncbi:MAG TPA: LLM class F420-dependent oxidoreductase [Acidimicrobiales bacterium]
MRHGVIIDVSKPIDGVVEQVSKLAEQGVATAWCSQIFGYDALTLLAVVGREVPGIELGTAVVPTYPRHPVMLAAQALTTQAATGGRLVLGIGLSHQIVIEGMFGYSFDRPARHMREYLSALMPLLDGQAVSHQGETVSANTMAPLDVVVDEPPPVLLAALGPTMLKLAGQRTAGTVTWMTGPATIASHIVPSITKAAEDAGKPPPRVAVGLPVAVTTDVERARETADRTFAIYGQLPSYRAMLDREGAEGPAHVAIVGDEESVASQIQAVADAGATDFSAAPFGSADEISHTVGLIATLAKG